jgi:hypothetical protein
MADGSGTPEKPERGFLLLPVDDVRPQLRERLEIGRSLLASLTSLTLVRGMDMEDLRRAYWQWYGGTRTVFRQTFQATDWSEPDVIRRFNHACDATTQPSGFARYQTKYHKWLIACLKGQLEYLENLDLRLHLFELPSDAKTRLNASDRTDLHINISGGAIGQFNVAEVVRNIKTHISSVDKRGDPTVATALQAVTEAVVADAKLSTDARRELLELIEDLSEQAMKPPNDRRRGRIGAAMKAIATAADLSLKLGEVWNEWGSTLMDSLL